MRTLLNDMLKLAETDSPFFEMKPKNIQLDTLLLNCAETFESMANEQKIQLSVQLPSEAIPLCLADPERIQQVLSILLHNALHYTPTGGTIILSLSITKHRIRICVSDTGIGIANADKKQVFERFYQAERSQHEKGHFGLGLSIAREIMRAHKGKILVSDTPGGGSTFTLELQISSASQQNKSLPQQ